jgi:hypothetical protein
VRAHLLNIDTSNITILQSDIITLLGDEYGVVDSYTEGVIDKCISACRKCMSPQGSFIQLQALKTDASEQISIENFSFQTGRTIKKMLAGSETYVFLIATVGPGPETLARELLEKGEFLEGYIADLVASALVESVANQVQDQIRQVADQSGLKITNRYCPGYCKWDVSEQQNLFKLFPENCCGITLGDSSLMSPIKSISAVMGLGSSVAYREYTCEICSMKECLYRKTRNQGILKSS